MTLEEYATKHNNYIDIDVSDSVYDVLANYTYDFLENPKDSYDKLMVLLGQNINISANLDNKQLVCNFYDFFENHKETLKEEFFSNNFSEKLILDLDNILSGNNTNGFYDKLYSCLNRDLNKEKGYGI